MEYKIVLEPDVEDGGYVVHCPTLPGCYSQGDTREEAIENIRGSNRSVYRKPEKGQLADSRGSRSRDCEREGECLNCPSYQVQTWCGAH
jgi:hypothetical protein